MSLKRIAEELGLSLTTVSRALNGYPEVAESTRTAVAAAAARLNHKPDARARGLALGRSGAVGIVLPLTPADLGDLRFMAVMQSTQERLSRAGMDLLIVSSPPDDELGSYRRAIASRRVDAFIVPRTRVQDERLGLLHAAGVPFVTHGRSDAFPHPYAWFDFDNVAGAHMATQRLVDLGHRRVGYLGAPAAFNFACERYQGFETSMRHAGLAVDPLLVHREALDRRTGRIGMERLLGGPRAPSAVLVDNHHAGSGALEALARAGLQLGVDISLIVYDGVDEGESGDVPVTAVVQPTSEISGTVLAELLLARLAGEAPERLHALRVPVLIPGASDAAPSVA